MVNSMEINERTYRINEGMNKTCEICKIGVIDGAFEITINLITECETCDNE